MKRRMTVLFIVLLTNILVLSACTSNEEDFDSFSLEIIGLHGSEEEGIPYLYIVNPEEAPGEIGTSTSIEVSSGHFESEYESYDLESTNVTDEEISIAFNGETLIFKRLSQSVVEDKHKVQYQYREIE